MTYRSRTATALSATLLIAAQEIAGRELMRLCNLLPTLIEP